MVEGRTYHSPRREAQAKATRREILETARRLFRENGYAATSVPDVARAAGVSTKTVYLSFPTKRQLLLSVWDLALHHLKERFADVLEVIRSAAAADPELAELWRRMQAEFHENQGRIIKALHAKGGLRPDLTVDAATDVLWTLNHPTVYQMLVTERGWSRARYREWLAATLRQQLLAY
jgi:AcrR family transcriptional regulator